MKSMVFAAGLGTRLRPLTDTRPKALVTVGNRTLLEIVLSRLASAGAEEAVVNVHHHAAMLADFIRTHSFPLPVAVSDESDALLNTGGGLRRAATFFRGEQQPVLIHNVDILSNADLAGFHRRSLPFAATLLVSRRQTSRYLLFDARMRLVGWTNLQTGEVRSPYADLRPETCTRLAFSGIHAFSPRLFPLMESFPEAFSIIDFYLSVCDKVEIHGYEQPGLRLLDVGKPEALAAAPGFLKSL
ncbi:MAG: nucleotidyltransferase family protein [Alloprevotella sp.]|nr:nucleotidyltransferase family protein [Alloprevotella sp.]